MKIRYINEGIFKNPEQARAAREKEKSISNVDKLISTSNAVIRNEVLYKSFKEDLDLIIYAVYNTMGSAIGHGGGAKFSACQWGNVYSNSQNKFTADKKRRWNMTRVGVECQNKWKIISNNAHFISSLGGGIWKDKNKTNSCKRLVMLEYVDNKTDYIEDVNCVKVILNQDNIVINIYALVTGYDNTEKGLEEHLKYVESMYRGVSAKNTDIDNYFVNMVTEIVDIKQIKNDLKVIEDVFSSFLYDLFATIKADSNIDKEQIDEETFKEMFPVRARLIICRTHLNTNSDGELIDWKEEHMTSADLEKSAILRINS